MVECLTRVRRAAGSSLTGITVLCHWARRINPILVLVQSRKTRPWLTERLLMGGKESNQTTKKTWSKINFLISQPKHMLWVLKRTVSMRQFFWATKTNVKTDGLENIYNFKLIFCFCYPPTKSEGYSFGVVRASVRLSVRPFRPSVRPSVRNHISVPIVQIWFILGTNDKYHGLSNIQ